MTMNYPKLPSGFSSHPANMGDLENAVALLNICTKHHAGIENASVDNLKNKWTFPGYSLEKDTRLIFDDRGDLVGYADFWEAYDPPVHPRVYAYVHPEHENKGVGEHLLTWIDERGKMIISRVDEDLRVAPQTAIYSTAESKKILFVEHGYRLFRHSFRMQIDMHNAPPAPIWPDGITLKPFDPDEDMEAVYRADNEAFQDHYGYIEPADFQQDLEDYIHYMTGDEAYDPSLWFMAMDGNDIAAICICRKWAKGDKECGFVSVLGVRKPYRKHGLGLAFLHHSFGEFYRRGLRKVALDVDAQNLTGALRLYEKAGMYVSRQTDEYEIEIWPGREISVQSLE